MSPETVDEKETRKVKVRCTFTIVVDVPVWATEESEYNPYFDLEENHCPGTGIVGSALDAHIARHEAASTCWACALQGKNEILEIDGEPVKPRPGAPPIAGNAWFEPAVKASVSELHEPVFPTLVLAWLEPEKKP
jgi:hypothetical protein